MSERARNLWVVWIAVGLVGAGLTPMLFLVRNSSREILAANAWVSHTNSVLEALQDVSDAMRRDDQTIRTCAASPTLVTSRMSATLGHEEAGEIKFAQRLRRLTADNPAESRRAGQLLQVISASVGAITVHNAQDTSANYWAEVSRQSSQDHAAARSIIRAMTEEERDLLADREAAVVAASHRTSRILYFLVFACGLLVVGSALVLRRDTRARLLAIEAERDARRLLQDSVARLESHNRKVSLLNSLAASMEICATPVDVFNSVSDFLRSACSPEGVAIFLTADSRTQLERVYAWGSSHAPDFFAPVDCCALRSGRPYLAVRDEAAVRCQHTGADENCVCIPLSAQGETIGIVSFRFSAQQLEPVRAFLDDLMPPMSSALATTLANLKLRERLRNQSIRDALTGLFNRRYLEETLSRELRRALRRERPLAVLMLDVDHFKRFNDVHGHAAGDAVLQELGHCLGETFRAEDIVCRYGGEEFAVVIPEIEPAAVPSLARNLLRRVQEIRIRIGSSDLPPISISGGVAVSSPDLSDPAQILQLADQRLYQAKHAGRNRIVTEAEELAGISVL